MIITKEQAIVILEMLHDVDDEYGMDEDQIKLYQEIFKVFPELEERYGGLD